MEASDFPQTFDVKVIDPVTGDRMAGFVAVSPEKLDSLKEDLADQYPGSEIEVTDHEPDLLDIPAFLRRT